MWLWAITMMGYIKMEHDINNVVPKIALLDRPPLGYVLRFFIYIYNQGTLRYNCTEFMNSPKIALRDLPPLGSAEMFHIYIQGNRYFKILLHRIYQEPENSPR